MRRGKSVCRDCGHRRGSHALDSSGFHTGPCRECGERQARDERGYIVLCAAFKPVLDPRSGLTRVEKEFLDSPAGPDDSTEEVP